VHDLVELRRQSGVNRGDGPVDRPRQIAVKRNRAGQRLLDKRFDELLSAIGFGLLGSGDDLLQQAAGEDGLRGGRSGRGLCG